MIFPTYPSPCLTSDPLVRLAKTAADDHHAGLRCYLFIRMRFLVISHFGGKCLLLELHSEVRVRRFVQLPLGSHKFMQDSLYFLVLDLRR